ncbi:MAG TPA: transketolase C-terminal domain-containing protein, partial [Candidatus Berkiella sp.]|nr:transketolase C-terminal domain-containing protein [Candidatus Berkiella sp.]
FGAMFTTAQKVAEQLGATLVNMRFVKPLDEDMIITLAKKHTLIVTLEENVAIGGAGEGVSACLQKHHCLNPTLHFGLPDHFVNMVRRKKCLLVLALMSRASW